MPAIMIQATGSDAGKSLVVAGLCRLFSNQGLKVRPFKPQNMSNNAAVTADGGEIGRAQSLQAMACNVEPTVDMNPVLLKPETERGAQVIVRGKRLASVQARDYSRLKPRLMAYVLDSYRRLSADADMVIIEGAGSPAEINLRAGDVANMGFAEAADIPVLLLGDIDRGGVIASMVGTHLLLPEAERRRIKGFIINKFRGDVELFQSGADTISQHTGWPLLGIVPWFDKAALLPQEDALGLPQSSTSPNRKNKIAVLQLPRIANFDDLDPLRAEPDVELVMVTCGHVIPADSDLVIIPGSKSTMADLHFVIQQGWDVDIKAHIRRGGRVLGICGGYQMLGNTIDDPHGVEGSKASMDGLGLLDVTTILGAEKSLHKITGTHIQSGQPLTGYEIHLGQTAGKDCRQPFLEINGTPEGAISACGQVFGTYIHGLFAADDFRRAFLAISTDNAVCYAKNINNILNELATHMSQHIDCEKILEIARREC